MHQSAILDAPVKISDKIQFEVSGNAPLYNEENFMRVTTTGDLAMLKIFLDSGISVDTKADDQSTALHCAARAGQAAVVEYLLTKGASVKVLNDKRRLPIHEAILSSSPETLKCLLELMAQDDLRNSRREIEGYMVRSGNADIIDVYLTRLGSDFTERDGTKKLSFAVRTGHCSLVTALLDDPKISGNVRIPGHSLHFAPIHQAAMLGRTKVMESLITSHRIDVNLGDSLSRRALHIAALGGHTTIVEQLIGHSDVDINVQDARRRTPLHFAASNGHSMVVAQLIRHPGVDVDCQDQNAATPLHYAASNGHWRTASLLLKHLESMEEGCCISSDVPPTGLSFTKEDLLDRLLERPDFGGPNGILPGKHGTILGVAATKDDCEMIEILLAYPDIDVNASARYGDTALIGAAQNGSLEAVKLLLQHKDIDVNQKGENHWNQTALQDAKRRNHNEIVNLLLSHGAIDYRAEASTNVPTPAHIDNSQNTTLQPDDETHFDYFDDDMDDVPNEAWGEFWGMQEGVEE